MPKSRHRKNHKQKVKARATRIQHEKHRMKKMQQEFLMNLIKREQEKGMFSDNPTINPVNPSVNGPIIDGPIIEGPSI